MVNNRLVRINFNGEKSLEFLLSRQAKDRIWRAALTVGAPNLPAVVRESLLFYDWLIRLYETGQQIAAEISGEEYGFKPSTEGPTSKYIAQSARTEKIGEPEKLLSFFSYDAFLKLKDRVKAPSDDEVLCAAFPFYECLINTYTTHPQMNLMVHPGAIIMEFPRTHLWAYVERLRTVQKTRPEIVP